MIVELLGDVLECDADIIAHQTNCVGVMGAGVAAQIKKKLSFSEFASYQKACDEKGAELLGSVQFLKTIDGKIVANIFGENIPTASFCDTDYEALRKGLNVLHTYALIHKLSVAIPGLMGCGLAGGSWKIVRDIIEDIFGDSEVSLKIVFFDEYDFQQYVIMEKEGFF